MFIAALSRLTNLYSFFPLITLAGQPLFDRQAKRDEKHHFTQYGGLHRCATVHPLLTGDASICRLPAS
jgi:hypothetical protein